MTPCAPYISISNIYIFFHTNWSFSFYIILAVTSHANVQSQLIPPSHYELSEAGRSSFPELAKKLGYPAKEKFVITEDGYNLTLFHIPGNKKRAVLLVHGNTPTADCWISRGENSLAITLAKQAYDVWAINLRGSRYSRRHISLDPDRNARQFYNFSFYEQSIYDLPATIDHVLQETEQKQLLAIGHSVGCSLFYVLGAERPEYNNKMKLAVSLAPISFIQNLRGLVLIPITFSKDLIRIFLDFNFHEVLRNNGLGSLLRLFCFEPFGYVICVKIFLFGILGYDEEGFEPQFVNTFFGHWPGGSSTKTFVHLVQVRKRNKFAHFDYGRSRNMATYGSREPPEFDLSKVTMRSALFVGREDFLATVADAELLNSSLPNVVHYQVMPYAKFNHGDFVWGRNMTNRLYPFLLDVIKKYS